jgi:FKBP-type peptidyl-prolyl cis-trans isomerase 2
MQEIIMVVELRKSVQIKVNQERKKNLKGKRHPAVDQSKKKMPIGTAGVADKSRLTLKTGAIMLAVAISFFMSGTTISAVESPPKTNTVVSGDPVDMHFTCRFKNGETAISTYQDLSNDQSIQKSTIFLERDRNTPIELVAEKDPPKPDRPQLMGFESWLFYRLSPAIVGLERGKKTTVEINAERLEERQKNERSIKMARVRQRPKENRMSPKEYKSRTGKTPEIGQPYIIDPAVPGNVASVTEKEVAIRFSAAPRIKVATPFGEGTVKEYEDHYEIIINAQPGTLVRNGGIVGRITNVDERYITIDYGHPFGGEPLFCDVLIEPKKRDDTAGQLTVPRETGGT